METVYENLPRDSVWKSAKAIPEISFTPQLTDATFFSKFLIFLRTMVLTFFLILNKLEINHFKYLEKVSELFTTLSQFLSLK